jgi:hypothetical protein
MTTPRIVFPLLIIVATIIVSPACYTLLKHPQTGTAEIDDSQDTRCVSCHNEDDIWSYHHPANHRYYPGAGIYYDWGFYYAVPWWYGTSWQDSPPDGQTTRYRTRFFRPTGAEDAAVGATGGPVGNPPPAKATGGSIRTGRGGDTRKGKTVEKTSKKRTVRPKGKKGKEDG